MLQQTEEWNGDPANHPTIHCNRLEDGFAPKRPTNIKRPPRSFPPDPSPFEQRYNPDPPAVMVGERRMIVGVCGLKGHGKDTAVQILQNKYGFTRLAFADGVKKVVAEILHVPLWWLHDPAKKEELHVPSGKTYRQWMQLMGTEVGRNIWGDAWINWWKGEVENLDLQRVVVTDMRFWNEFSLIDEGEWDSLTLRVFNPRLPTSKDTHESEMHAFSFPVQAELTNSGAITELWELAESALLKRFPRLWVN